MIVHRDAEVSEDDSSLAWSLEAEIPRHEGQESARRLDFSRSRGFAHGDRVSEGMAGDGLLNQAGEE